MKYENISFGDFIQEKSSGFKNKIAMKSFSKIFVDIKTGWYEKLAGVRNSVVKN